MLVAQRRAISPFGVFLFNFSGDGTAFVKIDMGNHLNTTGVTGIAKYFLFSILDSQVT